MARIRRAEAIALKCVETLLKDAFPAPDRVSLEDDDGIIGVITSARFRGLESMDRQNLIWQILDARLSPEQRRRVVIMAAVTPEEHEAIQPLK